MPFSDPLRQTDGTQDEHQIRIAVFFCFQLLKFLHLLISEFPPLELPGNVRMEREPSVWRSSTGGGGKHLDLAGQLWPRPPAPPITTVQTGAGSP